MSIIFLILFNILLYYKKLIFSYLLNWGLGIGDWGLGIGDCGLGPIPNPQSPISNPHPQCNNIIEVKLIIIKI